MATPKRKIIKVVGNPLNRRTRGGIIKTVYLECGHHDKCNSTDRRKGWTYCFDCYYGKPADALGKMILEEKLNQRERDDVRFSTAEFEAR